MVSTVGKILLKNKLPSTYHDFVDKNELDKKGISNLFNDLAKSHPDKYADIVSDINRLGFHAASSIGSSVNLHDLLSPIDKEAEFSALEKEIEAIRKKEKDPVKAENEVIKAYHKFTESVNKKIMDVGVANNKTLAKVVKAGARGSPAQYRQTIFAPILVPDSKGNPITSMPIKHSYAEGLTLPEYLNSTYSARTGMAAVKLAVADAGALSKEMARGLFTVKVEEYDCGTNNGIPIHVDEKDYIGSFLVHPISGYNKNNEVTAKMLADLNNKGIKTILIRNPITCESPRKYHSGAVCQLCLGRREKGLQPIGDYVGITAGSALGESLSQGQLSAKHSAGSVSTAVTSTGYDLVKQLFDIPKNFKGKAAIAQINGKITNIRALPQGGHDIYIGDKSYYVPEGFDIKVNVGDEVEAGDVMSDGIPDPREIVKYKGIGEGRIHMAHALKDAMESGGMSGISKKNYDVVARGIIDHVRITHPDGLGEHLPNDIVSYQTVEKNYSPRSDSKLVRTDQALGKYLEKPVLQYTIGTKLSKKMLDNLEHFGVQSVTTHDKAPPFEAEMVRLADIPSHVPDWMTQLYSTHLERKLTGAVNTGMSSDVTGPSPIPSLATGQIGDVKKRASEEILESEEF